MGLTGAPPGSSSIYSPALSFQVSYNFALQSERTWKSYFTTAFQCLTFPLGSKTAVGATITSSRSTRHDLLVVTEEVFKAEFSKLSQQTAGSVIVKTSESEEALIAQLLGTEPSQIGHSLIKIPEGHKNCISCGRQFSFLDVVKAGVGVHGKDPVKDVLTNKYGCFYFKATPGSVICYRCGCGDPPIDIGYSNGIYMCRF